MASKQLIVDLADVDFGRVIADIHEIRRLNRQRYEMEQLTAIVYLQDQPPYKCVGYKDTTDQDFWVRGHMPGMPLMPGVVMLEAAAQLSSFITQKFDLLGADVVGFGGLEEVRFRDSVFPGDRLILMGELVKVRRGRMIVCQFQGVVEDRVVVEGMIKGVPISIDATAPLPPTATSGT